MTAKQGLSSLLTETADYDNKLYSDALSFPRQQKMSGAAIVSILDEVDNDSSLSATQLLKKWLANSLTSFELKERTRLIKVRIIIFHSLSALTKRRKTRLGDRR